MANEGESNLTPSRRYYLRNIEKRRKDARERLARWRSANPEKYRQQRATWRAANKPRLKAAQQKWWRNHRESHRSRGVRWAKRLKAEYGITPSMYADMLTLQENRCAICRTAEPGGIGSWHIDHDHSTNKIRGLLCNRCNMALGLFRDDPSLLLAANCYLERAKATEVNSYVQ